MTLAEVHVLATPDAERETASDSGVPLRLTLAFTDLEDFTTYTEVEGDDAARRLLHEHHRDSGRIVRSRGGRVLKRLGDGLMLAFPAPEAALLACLELGEAAPLRLRAGIHDGEVLVTGDDDVVGHVVNLAARLAASAGGGELVVTEQVRVAAGDLPGVAFDGPHRRRFKGIEAAVTVFLAARRPPSPGGPA